MKLALLTKSCALIQRAGKKHKIESVLLSVHIRTILRFFEYFCITNQLYLCALQFAFFVYQDFVGFRSKRRGKASSLIVPYFVRPKHAFVKTFRKFWSYLQRETYVRRMRFSLRLQEGLLSGLTQKTFFFSKEKTLIAKQLPPTVYNLHYRWWL